MYYLTKIFEKSTEHMPEVEVINYSHAFELVQQAMREDPKIVSMLIFSDKDTAMVVKRREIKYAIS